MRSSYAVFLGPGLASGLAGIGVLAELERRGVEVRWVIGANTGALAASLWAVESDLTMATRVLASLPWRHFVTRRDLGRGDQLLGAISLLTRNARIESCRRPISIMVKDMATGEDVLVEDGSIAEAVRGSMALPGLFEPMFLSQGVWMDGGLCRFEILDQTLWRRCDRLLVVRPRPERNPGLDEQDWRPFFGLGQYVDLAWNEGNRGVHIGLDPNRVDHIDIKTGSLFSFDEVESIAESGRRAVAQWADPTQHGMDSD